jgi:hypothetical protein
METTDGGMAINDRLEHFSKASAPISERLEVGSNITLESAEQEEKHKSWSLVTDEGMQIDRKNSQARNAPCPSRETQQRDSKTSHRQCGESCGFSLSLQFGSHIALSEFGRHVELAEVESDKKGLSGPKRSGFREGLYMSRAYGTSSNVPTVLLR